MSSLIFVNMTFVTPLATIVICIYTKNTAVTTNGNGTWVSLINNSTIKINDPLQCPMLWKDLD